MTWAYPFHASTGTRCEAQWFLAIPPYVVALALVVAALGAVVVGFFAVVFTGTFPLGPRDFIVDAWRRGSRVQAYVGRLTDQYPPFALRAWQRADGTGGSASDGCAAARRGAAPAAVRPRPG